MSATHQLLRESSRVSKRRDPNMCVAEFTAKWRAAEDYAKKYNPQNKLIAPEREGMLPARPSEPMPVVHQT